MSTYTVHAKPWKRGWELHIDGIGVTQARNLREAPAMVADYISLDTGNAPDVSQIEIIPEVGGGLEKQARAAREAVAQADRAQRDAASRSRAAARALKSAGLTGRDIAVVLRVSPQRVSQLLGGHRVTSTVSQITGRRGKPRIHADR
jgi:predicted transcriptional regulator